MQTVLVVIHMFVALGVIGLVLIQHGKGADAGAAFGSGASATVFGSQGSASFLTRATAVLAASFFITSMVLAYFSGQSQEPAPSLMDGAAPIEALSTEAPSEIPTAPMGNVLAPAGEVPAIPATAAEDAEVPAASEGK